MPFSRRLVQITRDDCISLFRFSDDVVFDGARNVLEHQKSGKSKILAPVVARLLIFFAKQPNQLLSRKEIMRVVWESYGFVVSMSSLNQTVYALRSAFAELDVSSVVIKTVPRIGYCFYYSGDVPDPAE